MFIHTAPKCHSGNIFLIIEYLINPQLSLDVLSEYSEKPWLSSDVFDSCGFSRGLIRFFLRDSEYNKLLDVIRLFYFVDFMHICTLPLRCTFYRFAYFYSLNLVCDLSVM